MLRSNDSNDVQIALRVSRPEVDIRNDASRQRTNMLWQTERMTEVLLDSDRTKRTGPQMMLGTRIRRNQKRSAVLENAANTVLIFERIPVLDGT